MSSSEAAITLYSYWRSSCSYRVRIALAYKGITYTYAPVHLLKDSGQQLTTEYSKLNPMREVPTLVIDGHTLTQSTAIIEYLEETRPSPALLPPLSDPRSRARVREICNIIANDIQPVQNLRVLKQVATYFTDATEKENKRNEWAVGCIQRGFTALESILQQSSGKYSVGDNITMADIFIVPQMYNAERFKVDLTPYPVLNRIYQELLLVPAIKNAHPSAQPDAEN